ncbi:homeobox protein cut-like 1 [Equus caballus]|uniref:homeobox protein cut-like 1 n=1 Tax=Equus caballus TaxID=9796 RepID=UPI0038B3B5FE
MPQLTGAEPKSELDSPHRRYHAPGKPRETCPHRGCHLWAPHPTSPGAGSRARTGPAAGVRTRGCSCRGSSRPGASASAAPRAALPLAGPAAGARTPRLLREAAALAGRAGRARGGRGLCARSPPPPSRRLPRPPARRGRGRARGRGRGRSRAGGAPIRPPCAGVGPTDRPAGAWAWGPRVSRPTSPFRRPLGAGWWRPPRMGRVAPPRKRLRVPEAAPGRWGAPASSPLVAPLPVTLD